MWLEVFALAQLRSAGARQNMWWYVVAFAQLKFFGCNSSMWLEVLLLPTRKAHASCRACSMMQVAHRAALAAGACHVTCRLAACHTNLPGFTL